MSKERKCLFCGNEYQYCPNCKDYNSYPTWMFNFDTEKCRDLYKVVGGYNMGTRTIEEVKSTLDKHGVTDYSIFPKALQEKLSNNTSVNTEEIKDEPKVEIKDELKVEVEDESRVEVENELETKIKDEPKKEVMQESNQKKQEFTKGNKNFVSRKMKKNNYGRRDGE